jgi:hypothetical protein
VKLSVVFDKQGNIVAAVHLDEARATSDLRIRPVALPDQGHQATNWMCHPSTHT